MSANESIPIFLFSIIQEVLKSYEYIFFGITFLFLATQQIVTMIIMTYYLFFFSIYIDKRNIDFI